MSIWSVKELINYPITAFSELNINELTYPTGFPGKLHLNMCISISEELSSLVSLAYCMLVR